jgi:hypothetical protein
MNDQDERPYYQVLKDLQLKRRDGIVAGRQELGLPTADSNEDTTGLSKTSIETTGTGKSKLSPERIAKMVKGRKNWLKKTFGV